MSAIATQNGNGTELAQNRRNVVIVEDEGPFANLLDTGKFEHLWRVSQLFSQSAMVPEHFRGHPADCFVATQMAIRLGVDPFMMLQNTYIVHGKPGMEAKLAIALINSSGLFSTSIDYQSEGGEDATNPGYKVRAFATRRGEKTPVYGPWVDWKMVRAEGWFDKGGSKWKTMPSMMFRYRAAAFFGRLHCPERLMGMQTADELHDANEGRQIEAKVTDTPRKSSGDLNTALAEEVEHQAHNEDDSQLPENERVDTATGEVVTNEANKQDQSSTSEEDEIRLKELAETLTGDWGTHQPRLRSEFVKLGDKRSPAEFTKLMTKALGLTPDKSTPEERARFVMSLSTARAQ